MATIKDIADKAGVSIEKKIENDGFTLYHLRKGDVPDKFTFLDGIICLGTFSKTVVEWIDSFKKLRYLWICIRSERTVSVKMTIPCELIQRESVKKIERDSNR